MKVMEMTEAAPSCFAAPGNGQMLSYDSIWPRGASAAVANRRCREAACSYSAGAAPPSMLTEVPET